MAAFEPRKSVRIIAFNAKNAQHMRTVNVITSKAADTANSVKPYLQLTAAQATAQHPTFMDSGGSHRDVPTIHVAGYSAPN